MADVLTSVEVGDSRALEIEIHDIRELSIKAGLGHTVALEIHVDVDDIGLIGIQLNSLNSGAVSR